MTLHLTGDHYFLLKDDGNTKPEIVPGNHWRRKGKQTTGTSCRPDSNQHKHGDVIVRPAAEWSKIAIEWQQFRIPFAERNQHQSGWQIIQIWPTLRLGRKVFAKTLRTHVDLADVSRNCTAYRGRVYAITHSTSCHGNGSTTERVRLFNSRLDWVEFNWSIGRKLK